MEILTSILELPLNLVAEEIIGRLLKKEKGYILFMRLKMMCKMFHEINLSSEVLRTVNFKIGKCFTPLPVTSYQKFVRECAYAGNKDANYFVGISLVYCYRDLYEGLKILEKTYVSSSRVECVYYMDLRYVLGLVSLMIHDKRFHASKLFEELYERIGCNLSYLRNHLLQRLIKAGLRNDKVLYISSSCASDESSCYWQYMKTGHISTWLYYQCCYQCLVVKEFSDFKDQLYEYMVYYCL